MVGNTLFKKKDIHKYSWIRQDTGRVVDRTMMSYMVVLRNVVRQLIDVRV